MFVLISDQFWGEQIPVAPRTAGGFLSLGYGAHEAFPFVKIASETQLACSLPAQTSGDFAATAAFGIRHIPILPARREYVCRKRIRLGAQRFESRVHFPHSPAEILQGTMESAGTHNSSPTIAPCRPQERQFELPLSGVVSRIDGKKTA